MLWLLRKVPLRITFIYVISATAWILFSDSALFYIEKKTGIPNPLHLHTLKGIFFVLITGIILYILIRYFVATLSASEKQYRIMFDENPSPMWVYDLYSLQFLAVNKAAIAYYGYTREEFLKMTIKDIRPKEDLHLLMEVIDKLHRNSSGQQHIWKHIRKNGEIIYVDIVGQTISFRKHKARLVLAKDITEKLNAEMEILNLNSFLVEQNEKLKRYGHIYSHQIRSPLANIMGLTNLMKSNPSAIDSRLLDMMDDACGKLDTEIRKMNDVLIQVEKRMEDGSR